MSFTCFILGYVVNVIGAILLYIHSKKQKIPMRMTWFIIIIISTIPYGIALMVASYLFISGFLLLMDWLDEK